MQHAYSREQNTDRLNSRPPAVPNWKRGCHMPMLAGWRHQEHVVAPASEYGRVLAQSEAGVLAARRESGVGALSSNAQLAQWGPHSESYLSKPYGCLILLRQQCQTGLKQQHLRLAMRVA